MRQGVIPGYLRTIEWSSNHPNWTPGPERSSRDQTQTCKATLSEPNQLQLPCIYREKGGRERTPNMRLEFLQQDIGRNLEDDIRDEENGQGGVIFGPLFDIQVLF